MSRTSSRSRRASRSPHPQDGLCAAGFDARDLPREARGGVRRILAGADMREGTCPNDAEAIGGVACGQHLLRQLAQAVGAHGTDLRVLGKRTAPRAIDERRAGYEDPGRRGGAFDRGEQVLGSDDVGPQRRDAIAPGPGNGGGSGAVVDLVGLQLFDGAADRGGVEDVDRPEGEPCRSVRGGLPRFVAVRVRTPPPDHLRRWLFGAEQCDEMAADEAGRPGHQHALSHRRLAIVRGAATARYR